MCELEKKSKAKITLAEVKTLDFVRNKIKDANSQLYDQLLVKKEERKLYFFTNYSAESLSRTVKKYEFPMLPSVESIFRKKFLGKNTKAEKIDDNTIFELIENLGVSSETESAKNTKKLAHYNEIPLELDGHSVKSEQPNYYIPSETITKKCHTCSGEKYTTCEENECHGQHVYTCSNCDADGETTCSNCDGRHEYDCPRCKGKGELTCFDCKNGKKKCNSCDGDGYKRIKYGDGRIEKNVCSNRCGNGWIDCTWCNGSGKQKCSSSRRGWMIGAVNKAISKEHCEGVGRITCKKCKPNGKIDCDRCETTGEITCEVCYGDHKDNRYGKVDCKTCNTAGELGVLTYVENKINYHTDVNHTCSTGKIETKKFSIANIKKFIGEIKQKTVYSNVNSEESNYDSFSKDLCDNIERRLGLHKDKYPKLLNEYVYYESIPCTTVMYQHILTGTEHKVSLVGIDTENPEVIFHSDPTKIEQKKGIEKNVFKDLIGKAFLTKHYKQKIEKRNEIILMVHVAKADGEIEDGEKEVLAKYITGLDDFTSKEKQKLFLLMAMSELPDIEKDNAIFYSDTSIKSAIEKMTELATKADGVFEDTENVKIEELKLIIQNASKAKKGMIGSFFSTWQISIPVLLILIASIVLILWFTIFAPKSLTTAIENSDSTVKIKTQNELPQTETKTLEISDVEESDNKELELVPKFKELTASQLSSDFPDISDKNTDEEDPEFGTWLRGNMTEALINVNVSSTLKSSADNSYGVGNLSDDDARTAWVEGKPDYGIGEYIEFDTQGLYNIRIYNGYQKDKNSYYNNSRVKSFKVFLDGEYVGVVNINDEPGEQGFDLSEFKTEFNKVKLEINEVYEGEKWKDVAITELFTQGG